MKKRIYALLVAVAVMIGPFAACKKAEKTIRELKEKTTQITILARNLSKEFNDGFEQGLIDRNILARYDTLDTAFGKGLATWRQGLEAAERTAKETGELPAGTLAILDKALRDEVIKPFFDMSVDLGLLPFAQSEKVRSIISGIRLLLLSLQSTFSDARHMVGDGRLIYARSA